MKLILKPESEELVVEKPDFEGKNEKWEELHRDVNEFKSAYPVSAPSVDLSDKASSSCKDSNHDRVDTIFHSIPIETPKNSLHEGRYFPQGVRQTQNYRSNI